MSCVDQIVPDGVDSFEHHLRTGSHSKAYHRSTPALPLAQSSSQPVSARLEGELRPRKARLPARSVGNSSSSQSQPSRKPAKRLIQSKDDKETILREHQEIHGVKFSDPIVTLPQGEQILCRPYHSLPTQRELVKNSVMKPRQTASYRAETATFHLSLLPILSSGFFDIDDYGVLRMVASDISRLVKIHLDLLDVDITPLLHPRYDFDHQQTLQKERIDMATALFLFYGGDPGKVIRAMNHEYVLANLDREAVLSNIKDIASPEDYAQITRILYDGCPAQFNFDEPNKDRLTWFDRGNQPSYTQNPKIATKTLNKEDKKSHLVPIYQEVALFSPYCRHTPQGMVIKPGANPRVVWDGSTRYSEDDITMNSLSSIDLEAPITFGSVESEFDNYLYQLRVSYPSHNILMGTVDIASCFRFGRIPPELAGAFGFLAGDGLYCLANAMVFGHKASANSWEPFRRTIEELTVVLANAPELAATLVKKHRHYLDMIQWDESPSDSYVRAQGCPLCPGVLGPNGIEAPSKTRFYVDDGLLAAINRTKMEFLLAATIEAIIMVMGDPDPRLRTCPLSLDKWKKLIVGPRQVFLALAYNTVTMTKGTTDEYRTDLLSMMRERWSSKRVYFTARDAQVLVGKLARLAKGARWVFHLLSHMYDQIALALASNRRILAASSPRFRAFVNRIKQNQMGHDRLSKDGARVVSFALKKAAQLVHHHKQHYLITAEMRNDIEFFLTALQPDSGISWHVPLAHVVTRTPLATLFGDASLHSCGGYSFGMSYWWHVPFPDEVVRRTLLHLPDNSTGNLISINALEFVTIILSYCAALTVLSEGGLTEDLYPVVLAITDNTSALNWVNHCCKASPIGKALSRLLVCLLIDSLLGINADWISTDENMIADGISRLKKESATSANPHPSFDYSSLPQKFPVLANFRFWAPSQQLLSMIWKILLSKKSPSLKAVRELKLSGLGRLSTSPGVSKSTSLSQ